MHSYPLDGMKFSGQFTIRVPYPWENGYRYAFNPLSPELNPICYLLALL